MASAIGHSSTVLLLVTLLSLLLTVYTLYVEKRQERDNGYKPLCDISDRISCSKAFNSRFGKGFGIFKEDSPFNLANPVYGLLFYITQLFICCVGGSTMIATSLVLLLSITSNVMSVYLAYLLYRMNNLCIVCAAIYCTNAVSLIVSIYRWRVARKFKHKME